MRHHISGDVSVGGSTGGSVFAHLDGDYQRLLCGCIFWGIKGVSTWARLERLVNEARFNPYEAAPVLRYGLRYHIFRTVTARIEECFEWSKDERPFTDFLVRIDANYDKVFRVVVVSDNGTETTYDAARHLRFSVGADPAACACEVGVMGSVTSIDLRHCLAVYFTSDEPEASNCSRPVYDADLAKAIVDAKEQLRW
jgi:hypothetical protein